jgi:hypothetical protein
VESQIRIKKIRINSNNNFRMKKMMKKMMINTVYRGVVVARIWRGVKMIY